MKKYFLLTGLVATSMLFTYCSSTKKTAAAETPAPVVEVAKANYAANVDAVIQGSCSPCHIPAKGGRVTALDTYTAVKGNIDAIIQRVELNPGDRGFMPFKKTEKLSAESISLLKKWKADGLMEK
jgi:uncharacterized membrane protein